MEETKAFVEFYRYMSSTNLPRATITSISHGEVPGVNTVFKEAAKLYKDNPKFRQSVIVSLLQGAVAKAKFGSNAATEERCVNFFRYIRSISKVAYSALRINLNGPTSRWMEKLASREGVACIVDSGKDGALVVKRMEDAIKRRCPNFKDGGKNQAVPFSIGIDATKVAPSLDLSARFKKVLGGEHPNDVIPIDGMSKEEVTAILDGKSMEYGDIEKCTEIKVAVMSFQSSPDGVAIYEIVAARPQSNNESNDFVKDMEAAASSAMISAGVHGSSFLNFAVDGVSCESRHVCLSLCDFLSCKSNHTGSTDPNHNCKSWRYQVVALGDLVGCTIGRFVLDIGLLRLSQVPMDLIRPVDFASDRLVLQLYSNTTLQKICQATPQFGSTCKGDEAVLATTFFFLRLHLHAVNGKSVPAMHRAQYLWCSMLWLTSINGASIITKRNIVMETLSMMFIVMRADVSRARLTTSESCEHTFGNLRQMIREFTVLEFAQLTAKLISRLNLMYKNSFGPSNCPRKGYGATYHDYFHYGLDSNSEGCMDGTINVQNGEDYVAKRLWETVSNLITFSSDMMRVLLKVVGVTNAEMSPFCRTFLSLEDLRDEFIRYLPRTFVYQNIRGGSAAAENESSDSNDDDGKDNEDKKATEHMVERIKMFADSIMAEDNAVVVVDEVFPVTADDSSETPPSAQHLMTCFRSIFDLTLDISEVLERVSCASSCLANSEHTPGSISPNRKAKSLVQRWVSKPIDGVVKDGKDLVGVEHIFIKRDVIVLLDVKCGVGAGTIVVQRHFRVLEISEKYYNKWFVSPAAAKKWKNEKKPFKISVRMLKLNTVGEYSDEEMYGTGFHKDEICKNVEDRLIVNVVGKLHVIG